VSKVVWQEAASPTCYLLLLRIDSSDIDHIWLMVPLTHNQSWINYFVIVFQLQNTNYFFESISNTIINYFGYAGQNTKYKIHFYNVIQIQVTFNRLDGCYFATPRSQ